MENGLGGPIVFLKTNDFRFREEAFEFQDVCDFRSTPAVDRLIVITYHADMIRRADELLKQTHLQRVRVLELIDRDSGVEFTEVIADITMLAQDLLGEDEEVIEIDRVLRAEFVLISNRELGEVIVLQILDIDPSVFCTGDFGENRLGFDFLIGATFADEELFHDADLI